ncbi:MAG: hypothetical protein K5644_08245, partial [Lachnospiraceae bacterium]|nr:hypothetical protein [Lachnospiraceae bacterium]
MVLSEYLRGLAVGFPLNLGVALLIPLMNIDGDRSRVAVAINVLFFTNLIGDIIVAVVFEGNMFGLALATSVSYLCAFIVLLLHFRKRSVIKLTKPGGFMETAKAGTLSAITRFFSAIRAHGVNIIFLAITGAQALAANTLVQSNIKAVPMCIAAAIGSATLSIVSVLFEEHDLRGLRQILRSVLFISFGPCLIIAILVFVFAPQIVG